MNHRQNNMTDMGFTKERYPAGTHMCLLYSHENERRNVIGKFLESGIIGNDKVSYFADSMNPEEVREWLLNMDIELPENDDFSIHVAEKTYCPDGVFVPETMLNTLRSFYTQAMSDGNTHEYGMFRMYSTIAEIALMPYGYAVHHTFEAALMWVKDDDVRQ